MRSLTFAGVGLLAVFIYCAAVVLGGLLWPTYSHTLQPVSDLIATGSPVKSLLDPLFLLYNVLTATFAWGLRGMVRRTVQSARAWPGLAGAWALLVEAVAGVMTLAFPEGQGGAHSQIGPQGFAHILFAGISSVCTLLAIPLLGHWLAVQSAKVWFRRFSIGAAVAVALTGVATAVAIGNRLPWGGLAERLTIGCFLVWLATAAALIRPKTPTAGAAIAA
jgi:hypothetical protein